MVFSVFFYFFSFCSPLKPHERTDIPPSHSLFLLPDSPSQISGRRMGSPLRRLHTSPAALSSSAPPPREFFSAQLHKQCRQGARPTPISISAVRHSAVDATRGWLFNLAWVRVYQIEQNGIKIRFLTRIRRSNCRSPDCQRAMWSFHVAGERKNKKRKKKREISIKINVAMKSVSNKSGQRK